MDDDLRKLYNRADHRGISIMHADMSHNVAVATQYGGSEYIVMDYRQLHCARHHKVVLAHELGHLETGSLYLCSSPYETRSRCEARATRWAIETLLPFDRLRSAMREGYTETWELAEYFNIDESLVISACIHYTEVCGFDFNS